MVPTATYSARTSRAIYLYSATITVWEWFAGRIDTVWMGWMCMSVHVIMVSLGETVISTLTIARESTAVEMAGALIESALSNASVIPVTLVCCVR